MAKTKVVPISLTYEEFKVYLREKKYHALRIKDTDALILIDTADGFLYSKKCRLTGSATSNYGLRRFMGVKDYDGHFGLFNSYDFADAMDKLKRTKFTKEDFLLTKDLLKGFRYAQAQRNPEYGVELEIESETSLPRAEIQKEGGKLIQDVGNDGSVRGGTEIRFNHPSFSGWKYKDVSKLLKFCADKGATTKFGTAGMHIHISRKDIGEIVKKFEQNLNTMQEILYPINCRKKLKFNNEPVNYGVGSNIYHNQLSDFGTLEIRAWNSTLDPKLFMARIKFCRTLTNWLAKAKDITVEAFFNSLSPAEKWNYKYMMNHPENPHEWGFPPKAINALLD